MLIIKSIVIGLILAAIIFGLTLGAIYITLEYLSLPSLSNESMFSELAVLGGLLAIPITFLFLPIYMILYAYRCLKNDRGLLGSIKKGYVKLLVILFSIITSWILFFVTGLYIA